MYIFCIHQYIQSHVYHLKEKIVLSCYNAKHMEYVLILTKHEGSKSEEHHVEHVECDECQLVQIPGICTHATPTSSKTIIIHIIALDELKHTYFKFYHISYMNCIQHDFSSIAICPRELHHTKMIEFIWDGHGAQQILHLVYTYLYLRE